MPLPHRFYGHHAAPDAAGDEIDSDDSSVGKARFLERALRIERAMRDHLRKPSASGYLAHSLPALHELRLALLPLGVVEYVHGRRAVKGVEAVALSPEAHRMVSLWFQASNRANYDSVLASIREWCAGGNHLERWRTRLLRIDA